MNAGTESGSDDVWSLRLHPQRWACSISEATFLFPPAYGKIDFKEECQMVQNHLPHDHGQTIEQELEYMPSAENFQTAADMFKQLGDGSRIRIFWLLCHCEECVVNLSAMVDMSSPAVSHHLKQLKSAGLIVSRRDGKEVYYKAADTVQARNFHRIIEWVVKIACPSQEEQQKGTS